MRSYHVGVVGATGLVGRTFLHVLTERKLPIQSLRLFASERSAGTKLEWNGQQITVEELAAADLSGLDIALFSAGGSRSRQFAEKFVEAGAVVIDNSSAWRMHPDVPLVVPEVNGHCITGGKKEIIANPNCSTIQLVMPLKPLHEHFGIERMVVSTYQAVSGSGKSGIAQMEAERKGEHIDNPFYPFQIDLNVLPAIGNLNTASGYYEEEEKVVNETRKILEDPNIRITCTAVRVPVVCGHSESVNLELKKPFTIKQVREAIADMPNVEIIDDPEHDKYPLPIHAAGSDITYVGRIRRDTSVSNGLDMWVVSDNVRKGAATNAVQIAEEWIRKDTE